MTKTVPSRRRLSGVVVSTAAQMTAVVRVDRDVAHAKYGKYFVRSKTYQIHDPNKSSRVGDTVEFEECRPISRHKRWRFVSTLKKATSTVIPTV